MFVFSIDKCDKQSEKLILSLEFFRVYLYIIKYLLTSLMHLFYFIYVFQTVSLVCF